MLDLYCGAGGATHGYQLAGFHVTGVDIRPQPNYCGDEFILGDALEHGECAWMYDFVHASPPCQHYSTASGKAKKHHGATFPDLIAQTRALLEQAGTLFVIENVVGAPLVNPVRYCGSSFGLDLRRHRLFEANFALVAPPCDHGWQTPRFRSLDSRMVKAGKLASVVGVHGNLNYAGEFPLRCKAMGIGWMSNDELVEAIPPAYTEHIGAQVMARLFPQEVAA